LSILLNILLKKGQKNGHRVLLQQGRIFDSPFPRAVAQSENLTPEAVMDLVAIPAGMTWLVELLKVAGFSGLIFTIWIITMRFFQNLLNQQKELMTATMTQQKILFETLINNQKELFQKIFDEQSQRNRENFSVLNKFAESIDYMAGQVSECNSKIENHHFCPVVRDKTAAKNPT
jgi:hypothetical protein